MAAALYVRFDRSICGRSMSSVFGNGESRVREGKYARRNRKLQKQNARAHKGIYLSVIKGRPRTQDAWALFGAHQQHVEGGGGVAARQTGTLQLPCNCQASSRDLTAGLHSLHCLYCLRMSRDLSAVSSLGKEPPLCLF